MHKCDGGCVITKTVSIDPCCEPANLIPNTNTADSLRKEADK